MNDSDPFVEEVKWARFVAGHEDAAERVRAAHLLRDLIVKDHEQLGGNAPFVRALVVSRFGHNDICPRILAMCVGDIAIFRRFCEVLEKFRGADIVHSGAFRQNSTYELLQKLHAECKRKHGHPFAREALFDGWLRLHDEPRRYPQATNWLHWRHVNTGWRFEQACRCARDIWQLVRHPKDGGRWKQVFLDPNSGYSDLLNTIVNNTSPLQLTDCSPNFVNFLKRLQVIAAFEQCLPQQLTILESAFALDTNSTRSLLLPQQGYIAGLACARGVWSSADCSGAFERFVAKPLAGLMSKASFGCQQVVGAFFSGLRSGCTSKIYLCPSMAAQCALLLSALEQHPDCWMLDTTHGLRAHLVGISVLTGELDLLKTRVVSKDSDEYEIEVGVRTLMPISNQFRQGEIVEALNMIKTRLSCRPGSYASSIFSKVGEMAENYDSEWSTRFSQMKASNVVRFMERDVPPSIVSWALSSEFDISRFRLELEDAKRGYPRFATIEKERVSLERIVRFREVLQRDWTTTKLRVWSDEILQNQHNVTGGELAEYWAVIRRLLRTQMLSEQDLVDIREIIIVQATHCIGLIQQVRVLTSCREASIGLFYEAIATAGLSHQHTELVMTVIQAVSNCRTNEQPLQMSEHSKQVFQFYALIQAQMKEILEWERRCEALQQPSLVMLDALRSIESHHDWPGVVKTLLHNVKNRCAYYELTDPHRLDTPRETALECLRKCRALLFDAFNNFEDVARRSDIVRDAVRLVRRAAVFPVVIEDVISETAIDVPTVPYLLIVEELIRNATRYVHMGAVRVYSPYDLDGDRWEVLIVANVQDEHRRRLLNALDDRGNDIQIDSVQRPIGSSGLGLASVLALATYCHVSLETIAIDNELGVGLKSCVSKEGQSLQ